MPLSLTSKVILSFYSSVVSANPFTNQPTSFVSPTGVPRFANPLELREREKKVFFDVLLGVSGGGGGGGGL